MYSIIRNKLISLDANEGENVALSEAVAQTSSVIEGSYNLEPNKYKSKYSLRTISLIYHSRSLRTTDTKLDLNNILLNDSEHQYTFVDVVTNWIKKL